MSATEYREYTLLCDRTGCDEQYGPFGYEQSLVSLREIAAKDGWTHVRSPAGRVSDDDYCPAHKEETP